MMEREGFRPATGGPIGKPPTGGSGGTVGYPVNPIKMRESAVELAIRADLAGTEKRLLGSAAAIEAFIRDGDAIPYRTGERTAAAFRAAGVSNLADMQAVLDAIETALAPAQPEGPFLPPDLADVMRGAAYSQLYAVQLVLAERARQAAKGWTAEHDDAHNRGEIANEAAAALAERYLVPRPAAREMAVSIVKAALAAAETPPLGQTVYGR